MKNKNINMLIVALLLAGLMAVMLMFFLEDAHDRFEEDVKLESDGITESVLSVRNLQLVPTQTSEYKVNLMCRASGDYFIYLDYNESVDGGMKSFVVVSVTCNGELIYNGSLKDLLDTDIVVEFEETLFEDEYTVIIFQYHMPYETGNEAQGTYSDFDINLTIKKS